MKDTSDITICSRIGSIGGLVTCANSWREVVEQRLVLEDSTASGESLPIEPVGLPRRLAIGAIMNLMSSCV